jgi:hypothetical protein
VSATLTECDRTADFVAVVEAEAGEREPSLDLPGTAVRERRRYFEKSTATSRPVETTARLCGADEERQLLLFAARSEVRLASNTRVAMPSFR